MSTLTTSSITKIHAVCLTVADVDRAIDFYGGTLGFEKRIDVPFGGSYRWVEVAVPGGETTIALAPPPEGREAGGAQTGISLHTPDIDALHAELQAAGVDIDDEVSRMGDPVPPLCWFRDPDGNVLMLNGLS